MNAVSTLNFENLPVRTFTDETNELWFCGVDVCSILGYANASLTIQKHCKENGVSKRYITDKLQRQQETSFINEPNLYRLIIKSRKPEAERFEAWVMEEVLPTIRKNGSYTQQTQNTQITYIPKTHVVEDDVLHTLFSMLFLAHAQAEGLKKLDEALQKSFIKLHPEAYSLYSETGFVLSLKQRSLRELLVELAQDSNEWKSTLVHFNQIKPALKTKTTLAVV